MMRNDLLTGPEYQGNVLFFLNIIEALALDERLLQIKAERKTRSGRAVTVSEPARTILRGLKDKVRVRYYASGQLPEFLREQRASTQSLLKEMAGLSGGRLDHESIDPEEKARGFAEEKAKGYLEALKKGETPKEPEQPKSIEELFSGRAKARKTDAEIAAERRKKAAEMAKSGGGSAEESFRRLLLDEFKESYLENLKVQGIYPLQTDDPRSGLKTSIYLALEVLCGDRPPEVIPGHVLVENLEYDLVKKSLKVTSSSRSRVVFFDGRKAAESDYSQVLNALGDFFDLEETGLKEGDSLGDAQKPGRASVLIIAQPHDLEADQLRQISSAISGGIPAIFLVSGYSADLSAAGRKSGFPLTVLRPGLADLFRKWGVTLGQDLLASRDCAPPPLPGGQPLAGLLAAPMPIFLKASLDPDQPLMRLITTLVFPATVGMTLDEKAAKEAGLSITVLADSGRQSYAVPIAASGPEAKASVHDIEELRHPGKHQGAYLPSRPLAVLIEGVFPR